MHVEAEAWPAAITGLLKPTPRDFFVLKPHLSGFHETPLHMLLQSASTCSRR